MPPKSESKDGQRPSELTTTERRLLALGERQKERQNQFARSHPKLAAALDRQEKGDRDNTREDMQQISQMLLGKVIAGAAADPDALDPKKAGELLVFVRGEEMHQAKIDKLKADTESVTQNVATPTALRKLFNDFGLCIQHGNEEVVGEFLRDAQDCPERMEFIMLLGGSIHERIKKKIQQFGQEDTSMVRILAAMD